MADVNDSTDLLVVGKTGNGKSALGNAILRRGSFKSMNSMTSVTIQTQFDFSDFESRTIKVVDGPGLGDTRLPPREAAKLVVDKMSEAICANPTGFHAILLVLRYGVRFTKEDMNTLGTLKKIFGEKFITDHAILVMTCGDKFVSDSEESGETFEQWCAEQEGAFKELYKDVQNRVILFDNKTKDNRIRSEQLRKLLTIVDSMGERYTTEIFEEAKTTRDNMLRAAKRVTLNDKVVREAGLITQLLGRLDDKNSKEKLRQLNDLMKRVKKFHKDVLEQDKGTDCLSAAIKIAQNLKATIEEQLQEAQGVSAQQTENQTDEMKLQKQTTTSAEKREKTMQGLKSSMAADTTAKRETDLKKKVAILETDYQDLKDKSRFYWMKAAAIISSSIWKQSFLH